ncbi:transcription factor adf-1 [Plakobranchus ocellatus]|uniref:Transcription factor adf-1 n=1 Tax=Plakobranchus ocellatus TaxID=259542 RepID=A0AAV4D6Z0_9GAST|nr:transcription factor adf-1 [Plakobranchus ocellatus]
MGERDYKKDIIDAVRSHPVLWNPSNEDYKNQDKRKAIWKHIDSTTPPPSGVDIHAKIAWEQLTRCYANVLKRKDRRSESGAISSTKEWRYERDMMFLIPVKKTRWPCSAGNIVTDIKVDNDSNMCDNELSQSDSLTSIRLEDAFNAEEEIWNNSENGNDYKEDYRDHGTEESANQINHINGSVDAFHFHGQDRKVKRACKKSKKSHRLTFFKSLMPMIDNLTDDEFLDFQVNIIQDLKRFRIARSQQSSN